MGKHEWDAEMKVLFTGATGVVGRVAVPLLVGAGHDVTAVCRSDDGREWLQRVGARPVDVDLFDVDDVDTATRGADAVIHFATKIPSLALMVKIEPWAMNDELRDRATGLLVDAARANGVGRFVQQSITFFYADGGNEWLDEAAPVDISFTPLASAITAEGHVERFHEGGGVGISLRLARLYGPGGVSREYVEAMRMREIPVVGRGANYVSSLHIADAATAVAAALDAPDGTYNVGDDEPVTSVVYINTLAELLSAPKPRRIPGAAVQMALGKASSLLRPSQRVSNRKFRETTGWAPAQPTVVVGWRDVLTRRD
jgi:nucleoside-diphosphate-sugar epimerase